MTFHSPSGLGNFQELHLAKIDKVYLFPRPDARESINWNVSTSLGKYFNNEDREGIIDYYVNCVLISVIPVEMWNKNKGVDEFGPVCINLIQT